MHLQGCVMAPAQPKFVELDHPTESEFAYCYEQKPLLPYIAWSTLP